MKSALRKLIAFVFLSGIFWFTWRDFENLWNPQYMISVGFLVFIFGVFWFVVPLLVVKWRIFSRNRRNHVHYEEWKAKRTSDKPRPFFRRDSHLHLEKGEEAYFHEKGTFYVTPGVGFDDISVLGNIGEVAFPKEVVRWRKIQRVHFYLSNRRLVFVGKELDFSMPFSDLANWRSTVGGLVFSVRRGDSIADIAFTFQNPLIISDVLRSLLGQAKEGSCQS